MRGLPVKTLPLRVAVQGDSFLVESLADASDRLILSPVETTLEVSARVTRADVVVVDARSNPAAIEDIRSLQYDKPLLALVNTDQVAAAIAAGADGVLSGAVTAQMIDASLEALHSGAAVVSHAMLPNFGKASHAPLQTAATDAANVDTNLTQRENEVIVLMADGLSNKQIAARLGISEHTAKFHVNSILQKMNAQKRVEAVVRAAKLGILDL